MNRTMPVRLVERTEPKPGDRFFVGHRTVVANERGGWDEPAPVSHPNAGPAHPTHTHEAGGLALVAAAAIAAAILLWVGGHGLGWW